MQPTDYQSGRFSCSQGTEAARRNEREPGYLRKGLVDAMKSRVLRIAVILSSFDLGRYRVLASSTPEKRRRRD